MITSRKYHYVYRPVSPWYSIPVVDILKLILWGTSLTQEKWLWGFSLLEDTACNPFPPEKILSYPIEQKGLTT